MHSALGQALIFCRLPFIVLIVKNVRHQVVTTGMSTSRLSHRASIFNCVATEFIDGPPSPKCATSVSRSPYKTTRVLNGGFVPRITRYDSSLTFCRAQLYCYRKKTNGAQDAARVKPGICCMPLKLDDGWNQVVVNLAEMTTRAYGTNYVETLRVQIHANVRKFSCQCRSMAYLGANQAGIFQ